MKRVGGRASLMKDLRLLLESGLRHLERETEEGSRILSFSPFGCFHIWLLTQCPFLFLFNVSHINLNLGFGRVHASQGYRLNWALDKSWDRPEFIKEDSLTVEGRTGSEPFPIAPQYLTLRRFPKQNC